MSLAAQRIQVGTSYNTQDAFGLEQMPKIKNESITPTRHMGELKTHASSDCRMGFSYCSIAISLLNYCQLYKHKYTIEGTIPPFSPAESAE
jgi:hypothetical protein